MVRESIVTSEGLDPPDTETLPMLEPEPEVESEATERHDRSSKTKYPLGCRVEPLRSCVIYRSRQALSEEGVI